MLYIPILFHIYRDHTSGVRDCKKSTVKERPDGIIDPTKFNILSASPCCPRWISRPLFDPTEFSILGGRPACPADVPYFEMFLILSFTLVIQ